MHDINAVDTDLKLLRLKKILEIIPMSKSTFWSKVNEGLIPKPIHPFGPGMSFWRYDDIVKLIV